MRNRARLFILLALAPIIIGLAGFDSDAQARHRRYYAGFGRFGPCCQAPCPVACPAPCPVACPAPVCCPAPAPVISCPAPAPVISCPAPAPVISCPAPAPVISCPTCP